MIDKVIAAQKGVRLVERLPVQGKRQYWIQMPDASGGAWRDVRGPFVQRPAALRTLESYSGI